MPDFRTASATYTGTDCSKRPGSSYIFSSGCISFTPELPQCYRPYLHWHQSDRSIPYYSTLLRSILFYLTLFHSILSHIIPFYVNGPFPL